MQGLDFVVDEHHPVKFEVLFREAECNGEALLHVFQRHKAFLK